MRESIKRERRREGEETREKTRGKRDSGRGVKQWKNERGENEREW